MYIKYYPSIDFFCLPYPSRDYVNYFLDTKTSRKCENLVRNGDTVITPKYIGTESPLQTQFVIHTASNQ